MDLSAFSATYTDIGTATVLMYFSLAVAWFPIRYALGWLEFFVKR